MAQVTIYIPNDLETQVKTMANSLNISVSKYITTILKQKVQNSWNDNTRELAGSWDDFPALDEIRSAGGKDCDREEF